ncbi:MAG: MarR family transcriptional regulator [Petrimonas sp.]|nr:MarR family transcriptional regulator [Petrimonas sp.]
MLKVQDNEIFDILTGRVSGVINRSLLRAFAAQGVDITTEQWSVLACLWKKDKITQQALCDLTRKDKPSMTRLIDNLERHHLVVRVSDASDRRINLIHLTELGAEMQEKTTRIVEGVVNKALDGISDEELARSREVLLHIMKNLDS